MCFTSILQLTKNIYPAFSPSGLPIFLVQSFFFSDIIYQSVSCSLHFLLSGQNTSIDKIATDLHNLNFS